MRSHILKNRGLIIVVLGTFISCQKEDEEPCVYNKDVIDYYVEIANHFEDIDGEYPIKKWIKNPKIQVFGNPTTDDLNKLNEVISDINDLQDEIVMSLITSGIYNVEIHFIRNDSFPSIMIGANTKALGLFGFSATFDYDIEDAIILIDTDEQQKFRNATIREEVTQILGLPNDFDNRLYPNSIFNNQVSTLQKYESIDELIIKMHYSAVIKPGMEIEEIRNLQCWE